MVHKFETLTTDYSI